MNAFHRNAFAHGACVALLLSAMAGAAFAGAASPPVTVGTAARTVAAGDDARFAGRLPPLADAFLGEVATGVFIPNSITPAKTQAMSRSPHVARDDIAAAALVLPGFYVVGSSPETGPSGDLTYTASIEYPAGTFTQVKCSAAVSCVVTSGGQRLTDMATLAVPIPRGAMFWVRLFQQSPGGVLLKQTGLNLDNGAALAYYGSGGADQTMGGTIANSGTPSRTDISNNYALSPAAIVAQTRQRSFCFIASDSRTAGKGDTYQGFNADLGQFARSVGAFAPYINMGVAGDTFSSFVGSHAQRLALAPFCSDYLIGNGINDVSAGTAVATIEGYATTVKGYLPGTANVSLATLSPYTTSTDAWITPAGGASNNQSVKTSSGEAARVAYNEWCRTAAVPLGFKACLDIASAVEAGYNSGLWDTFGGAGNGVALTADGLHANLVGYLRIRNSGVIGPAALN